MKVLRSAAEDGYLDQAMTDGSMRIQVVWLARYPPLDEQFFRRRLDVRFALAYAREIGLLDVARKARSRWAERVRNDRCVVAGLGRVIESSDPGVVPGRLMSFIVPDSGPPSERYVVPAGLLGDPWYLAEPHDLPGKWQVVRTDAAEYSQEITRIAGWNAHSGLPWPCTKAEITALTDHGLLAEGKPVTCSYGCSAVRERTRAPRKGGLTIFGYGNYVKTMVIPQLSKKIPVSCVHEIDPWQIGRNPDKSWCWDTSPQLRPDECPDVVVVAGYHHTHAGVAVEAMRQGARAVIIEKPVVTTRTDLESLCAAAEKYQMPVFAAFQKRYSPFNKYIAGDLQVRPGEPVSCFALAYEVPLPPRHWYRWPNSGSSIISNGCHWIDHFLYLNDFSPVRQVTAETLGDASVFVWMILENEAVLSLSLTHEGSPRLGVREHCEFRANGVTATVTDAKSYMSESARGVIRKAHAHRYAAYHNMYRAMGAAIAAGALGDSVRSLRQSSDGVLAAEAALAGAASRMVPNP